MAPSSTEMVPAGKFKKDPPWTIGFSWPGVGNTWIVQTIQEIKYAGSHDPNEPGVATWPKGSVTAHRRGFAGDRAK